jgi:hypothetical protein
MIIQPHCFGPDVAQDGGSVWCNKASLLMVRKQKRQEKGRDHWIWHTELNVGNLWDSINIPDAVECILLWRYSFGSISMLWGNHRSNQDFIKPRSSTPTVKCAPSIPAVSLVCQVTRSPDPRVYLNGVGLPITPHDRMWILLLPYFKGPKVSTQEATS